MQNIKNFYKGASYWTSEKQCLELIEPSNMNKLVLV